MKIQTINYQRVQGLPNYSNLKVGVVVQVEEGESPDEAFEKARVFVHAKIRLLSGEKLDQPKKEAGFYGEQEDDQG